MTRSLCLKLTLAALAGLSTAPLLVALERPTSAFGLVGIARGQVARLSVSLCDGSVRPGDGSVRLCDGSVRPGVSEVCQVRLGFADTTGAPLVGRGGRVIAATGRLRTGESISFDLRAADALVAGRARRSVRAVVAIAPSEPDGPNACAGLVPTLELIDEDTGRTSFVYAPASEEALAARP
jgi:hypothetical protein